MPVGERMRAVRRDTCAVQSHCDREDCASHAESEGAGRAGERKRKALSQVSEEGSKRLVYMHACLHPCMRTRMCINTSDACEIHTPACERTAPSTAPCNRQAV
jgi:hypothetical protein